MYKTLLHSVNYYLGILRFQLYNKLFFLWYVVLRMSYFTYLSEEHTCKQRNKDHIHNFSHHNCFSNRGDKLFDLDLNYASLFFKLLERGNYWFVTLYAEEIVSILVKKRHFVVSIVATLTLPCKLNELVITQKRNDIIIEFTPLNIYI